MYPLLPVPGKYQGPSGEIGQILLSGRATKVTAFHAPIDDEADWHVYLDLPATTSADLRAATNPPVANAFDHIYCEVMVLDDWTMPTFGDDKFFSADVSRAFRLTKPGSASSAWDLMLQAIDNQGTNQDFSAMSTLIGGMVWMQGPFVRDTGHSDFRPEIHPLDSIAFAMDSTGKTVSALPGEAGWPKGSITWRVAWFANSRIHRINNEAYLRKPRTTTWLLPPPRGIGLNGVEVTERKIELLDVPRHDRYVSRGLSSGPSWELVNPNPLNPSPIKATLKVTATMEKPTKYGGLLVRDYTVVLKDPIVNPIPEKHQGT